MNTCSNCKFIGEVGDKDILINECRRYPPQPKGAGLSQFPLVKNSFPACGEYHEAENKPIEEPKKTTKEKKR